MERLFRWPYIATVLLLVYMPFHIFFSQWISTYTGELEFWKIWKDLLLFGAILLTIILVFVKNSFKDRLFWLFSGFSSLYFALHLLIWQLNGEIADKPALLATAYNSRLLGFAILGWGTAIVAKKYFSLRKIFIIVIAASTVVCILGIIQYNLPKDFMSHFGYSLDRGVKPNFFIDDKPDLPRIMSTLRDPNSLGAYLILPIALLTGVLLRKPRLRMMLAGLLTLHVLALTLTFSRSALAGTLLAVGLVFLWQYKDKARVVAKKYWPFLAASLAVIVLGVFLLRDQYFIQNAVFHSDENTQTTDSNNLHLDFAQQGIEGIAEEPQGHGPGTAGLVSIQTDEVVLTENYFIQVAYEVGLIGLALLLGLMYFVCRELYKRGDFYAQAMLAAFAGITFCALLLHTWSNEAVAAQWWLLAGLVIGLTKTVKRNSY